MEGRQDQLQRRPLVLGMHIDRNAAAIVSHGDGVAVLVQLDRDGVGVTVEVFIDGVVHDFPDEVMQSLAVHAADIHRRPLADRFETFENGNVFGCVSGRTHQEASSMSKIEKCSQYCVYLCLCNSRNSPEITNQIRLVNGR